MRRYLALTWSPGDQAGRDLALRHLDRLERQEGWRRVIDESGLALALPARRPPPLRRLMNGRGVIVGDLFPRRPGKDVPQDWLGLAPEPGSSEALCRRVLTDYWGRYVVIHQAGSSQAPMVFRDPSGALDCIIWRRDGLTMVASDLTRAMIDALPAGVAIDWSAIAAFLVDPAIIGARSALAGVRSVAPGELVGLDPPSAEVLWSPARYLSRERRPIAAAKAELVDIVDRCVAACAGNSERILAEVSGGLDSAIVASALARSSGGKVVQWLNYHVAEPQGDERAFARAAARELGLELTEAMKPELTVTEDHLAALGAGARPGISALDAHYDADVAQRCEALGADTILTGQGGDIVFFQMRTALVAADALRQRLPMAELAPIMLGVASWTRTSIWSVARAALLACWSRTVGPQRPLPPYLSPALRGRGGLRRAHPWLAGLEDLPPAKRLQIHALASAQLFHGACQRGEAADLIHPLLSQPVVEYCLGLASFDQTLGRRDRALAREAFAPRLPASIVTRRSKGDLTAYYGRMLARSVDVLRPFLLEGLLVREGLVVKPVLEGLLTPEALIWQETYPDIMELIAIEAWARRWQGELRNRVNRYEF